MTAAGPRSGDAPWDLSFLRIGTLVTAAVTVPAAALAGLLGGSSALAGVVGGAVVVTVFFVVSGVVVAWAGRIGDTLTLPAALLAFLLKALLLFAVLQALPDDGWIDDRALAWTVVGGALLWSGVQLRWVWTRPLYYVQPPAPPASSSPDRLHPDGPQVSG